MGYTLSALLIRGPRAAVRDGLKAYFKARGYTQARGGDDADITLRLYARPKDGWAVLAGEAIDEAGDEAARISEALGAPVVHAMNVDSDALLLTLHDGGRSEAMSCGAFDGMEAPGVPEDTPLWDALLGENAAPVKRLLREDRVFSEEALAEAAPLAGWPENILTLPLDDEAEGGSKPFCALRLKDGSAAFLMDRDAPPALHNTIIGEFSNPFSVRIESAGGEGRGVRVEFRAVGYDADAYEMPRCRLRLMGEEYRVLNGGDSFEDLDALAQRLEECTQVCVPERVVFPDGAKGWVAEFPDAPIERGVNRAHPQAAGMKADRYAFERSISVFAAILGPAFCHENPMIDAFEPDRRAADLRARGYDALPGPAFTGVRAIPMQNPGGRTEDCMCRLVTPDLEKAESWKLQP